MRPGVFRSSKEKESKCPSAPQLVHNGVSASVSVMAAQLGRCAQVKQVKETTQSATGAADPKGAIMPASTTMVRYPLGGTWSPAPGMGITC